MRHPAGEAEWAGEQAQVSVTGPGWTSLDRDGAYSHKSVHTETPTWMFTAALFTIARKWKQPKGPSTDEWMKRGLPTQWSVIQPQKGVRL